MLDAPTAEDRGANRPSDVFRVDVEEAIELLAGYGPLSSAGGVSRGAPVEIIRTAIVTCLGSSGAAGKSGDEKKAAEGLKPSALLAALREGGDKADAALQLLKDGERRCAELIVAHAASVIAAAACIGTHSDKLLSPSAPYGTLRADPGVLARTAPEVGVCTGTFVAAAPVSASGNAANMSAMRLLAWSGDTVLGRGTILDMIPLLSSSDRAELGDETCSVLDEARKRADEAAARSASELRPLAQHRILLWPIDPLSDAEDNYAAISPVASFSVMAEMERRIRGMGSRAGGWRFSTRKTTYGSGKAQNLGLLYLDASGNLSRLLNTPMPRPSRTVESRIASGSIRGASPRSVDGALVKEFQAAVLAEVRRDNAESRDRTDSIFLDMLTEAMSDTVQAAEAVRQDPEIAMRAHPALAGFLSSVRGGNLEAYRSVCRDVTRSLFSRLGGIRLGRGKAAPLFVGSDAQMDRFERITRGALKDMVR